MSVPQGGGASSSSGDLNAVLQDVVKAVAQQGKAISELINAVRNLTTPRTRVDSDRPQRATFRPRYTRDGQPICLRCEGVGHIARQCTTQPNQESMGRPQQKRWHRETGSLHCAEPSNERGCPWLKQQSTD